MRQMMLNANHIEEDHRKAKNAEHEKAVKRSENLARVEANLLKLNLDKDKYRDELSKLPAHPKTGAQIRRREFLDREI